MIQKPDENEQRAIKNLKNNPDFTKFMEWLLKTENSYLETLANVKNEEIRNIQGRFWVIRAIRSLIESIQK